MAESLKLCVSCKACKRECPTGVDMARMKIEVQAARAEKHGLSWRDKLVAYLPRYAERASRVPGLMNAREWLPGARFLADKVLGIAAERPLPRWRFDIFDDEAAREKFPVLAPDAPEVVLFADTFNRTFERENLDAALEVFAAAGWRAHLVEPPDGETRPLCCGRTFLSTGLINEARLEAERSVAALLPFAERGVPIVGLEPSCLYTFRDEIPALLNTAAARTVASQALLIEDLVARETAAGRMRLPLHSIGQRALLHGHCHQKAMGDMGSVERTLRLIPDLTVETIETSCCGMAGNFGYQSETVEVSKAMAELSLLPAVRKAAPDTVLVADGTSCRHQIADGAGREAVHVVRVLAKSLAQPASNHRG
jgi:Fe-S oxidoreductase